MFLYLTKLFAKMLFNSALSIRCNTFCSIFINVDVFHTFLVNTQLITTTRVVITKLQVSFVLTFLRVLTVTCCIKNELHSSVKIGIFP